MKVKTADLIDAPLDWAVAQCIGETLSQGSLSFQIEEYGCLQRPHLGNWKPSVRWSQSGPIIEHIKGFTLKHWLESEPETCCEAHIHNYEGNWVQFGPTPLIAACRCLVASKLGDEVDIPEELLK